MSEHDEQVAVINWADAHIDQAPCLEWIYAVINGVPLLGSQSTRSKIINYMKAEGMKPGILDLCLDAARHDYHGLKIEMKVKGGTVREGQIEYMDFLATEGYLGQVCYSAKEAVELLKWYLDIECHCVACQIVEE